MPFSSNILWSPVEYADAAVAAAEAGEEMLSRLDLMTIQPRLVLDMGCGTGIMSARLQQRYPEAQVIALDLSEAMLQYAKAQSDDYVCLCAAGETLPFRHQSVDLIFANFLLPWHPDLKTLLHEWRRVLRPDGLLMLNALGLDTLQEWHGELQPQDMPLLLDMHDVGDLLVQEGFADPVLDVNYYTITYKEKNRFLQELQASGMSRPQSETVLTPPVETWDMTCEVIFAHAFAPAVSEETAASADGIVRIPLSHLRQRLHNKS